MRLVIHLGNRYYQKSMLLTGIAADYGRAVIGPRHIRAKHLFGK